MSRVEVQGCAEDPPRGSLREVSWFCLKENELAGDLFLDQLVSVVLDQLVSERFLFCNVVQGRLAGRVDLVDLVD